MGRRLPAILAAFLVSSLAVAQSREERIDALLGRYHDYDLFNGSVLVADEGTVLLEKGYGYANREWLIPNTPDTKFRLGSITKQFTAMLVMQQVQSGTISLDAPLSKYLTSYPRPRADSVTIRQLLSHTAGIPNYTEFMDFHRDRKAYTPDQLIAAFSGRPLDFTPGTGWKYSNSGYVLLGAVLEKVTGVPYEQLLRRNILDPLGMKNTGYDHNEEILPKRAAGYAWTGRTVNASFIDMSVPFSAGALYSTAEDLLVWDRALYTDRLIADSLKAIYFTPVRHGYAFGWGVGKERLGSSADSALFEFHGGGINGFNTMIVRIPNRRALIVLLNNTESAPLIEIARSVAAILYGRAYAGPTRSIARELGKAIAVEGIGKALERYAELIGKPAEYSIDENEMNLLGYEMLREGRTREAIEVFTLNTKAFPQSWNVYDSLGEAYMDDGQRAPAIANYEKSIALNPSNTNGIEILKKLRAAQ